MNVLLKLAFDGSNYHGWQLQDNAVSVFEVFQDALIKILGHKTDIKGCSRTDTGVHAKSYYLSFTTHKDLTLSKLPLSLNANLPIDIRVISAKEVSDDFHARYSSVSKEYTYYIKNSHIDDAFNSKYYFKVPYKLDVKKMQEAAKYFEGEHDFKAFMSQKSDITDCVREVFFAKVEKCDDMIIFKISANGYLYNMVRIMAGTLIKVGALKINPEDVKEIINSKNRMNAGNTAPAKGLFLTGVEY